MGVTVGSSPDLVGVAVRVMVGPGVTGVLVARRVRVSVGVMLGSALAVSVACRAGSGVAVGCTLSLKRSQPPASTPASIAKKTTPRQPVANEREAPAGSTFAGAGT